MDTSKSLNYMGQSGYFFFFGWCEDRNDPLKIGRIRVRYAGLHTTDTAQLPVSSLPWAQVVLPTTVNDSSMVDIQVGTMVTGFFLDGEDMQIPVVNGHLPGMIAPGSPSNYRGYTDKTLSGYADGRKTATRTLLGNGIVTEPANPSAAAYPTNHCFETESGHVVEYDDTPGAERICITHKSGAYLQMDASGTSVIKSISSTYLIAGQDLNEYSMNRNIQIDKDLNLNIVGNCNITINGNSTSKVSGNLTSTVSGNGVITINGNANTTVNGDSNEIITGQKVITCAGFNLTSTGPSIIAAAGFNVASSSPVSIIGSTSFINDPRIP